MRYLVESDSLRPTVSGDIDETHRALFPELHEHQEDFARTQRATEELPEMRSFRTERRNFTKADIALAWAESLRSDIIWIDGYQLLTRADFNACFAFPLLQLD